MQVQSTEHIFDTTGKVAIERVTLAPVQEGVGAENAVWAIGPPVASVTLQITNPTSFGVLKLGSIVLVDLTVVP